MACGGSNQEEHGPLARADWQGRIRGYRGRIWGQRGRGRGSSVAGRPARPDPAKGRHGKPRMVVGRAGCSGRRRCWIRGQAWEWARDGLSGLVMGLAGFSFFNFFI